MKNLSNSKKFSTTKVIDQNDDEYIMKAATYPKDQLGTKVNPFTIKESQLTEHNKVEKDERNSKNRQTSNFGNNLPGSCDHNRN